MSVSAIAASKRYGQARIYEPPCTASLFHGGYDAPLIVGLWRWSGHTRPRTGGYLQQKWTYGELIDIRWFLVRRPKVTESAGKKAGWVG